MSDNSSLRDIFFQECEDLIDALTDGLNAISEGEHDDETVNAVFRAVHSIKGAAGSFALNEIVAFAHKFETVLDRLRSHSLDFDDKLVRHLMRAGDVLADLIDAARNDRKPNVQASATAADTLAGILGDDMEQEAEDFGEAFVFEPLAIAVPAVNEPAMGAGFRITFVPKSELYAAGHEPLFMLSELAQLGEMTVTADLSELPDSIDDFDWEDSRLSWRIDLVTDAIEDRIAQVFEFAEGLCSLQIAPLSAGEEPVTNALAPEGPQTAPESVADRVADVADALPPPAPSDRPKREVRATLRVDLERVDRLINAVGELIINQSMIAQHIEKAGYSTADEIYLDLEDYKLLAREIQEGVMAIRAQPVRSLFQRMSRIARETSDAIGKQISLLTEGVDTEIDKTVIERLGDPLTHMIRNAIDHGIECREDRLAANKSEIGTIRLRAQHRSGSVVIEVSDDGAGLDRDRILQTAIKKGIVAPGAELAMAEIDNLLFAPGFSTAEEVTNLSGRGVGMDVVKTAITTLGGRISISSVAGQGTVFTISLPLTLAVMDGMIVLVAGQTMVVPIGAIVETVQPTSAHLTSIGTNGALLLVRGSYVPIIDLASSLGQDKVQSEIKDQVLLIVQTDVVGNCALVVDAICDQRQVVIKSLSGNYGVIPGISAATILGDGKIALILDTEDIAARFAHRSAGLNGAAIEREVQHV